MVYRLCDMLAVYLSSDKFVAQIEKTDNVALIETKTDSYYDLFGQLGNWTECRLLNH